MSTEILVQQVLKLADIGDEAVGGKAHGLNQLMRWGLRVPDGFVITNVQAGDYPDDLQAYYERIGNGKVAVRSSALGEDGEESSFAGQYETILNVQGLDQLKAAIDQCVNSLDTDRAHAYQEHAHLSEATMCVVIQQMVDAKSAGVLFSVDPVSGRHDRLVIDAVNGLGEALVSGEETPDHYELNDKNQTTYQELVADKPILSELQLELLADQARQACVNADAPLDMEWAFNQDNEIFWLQARPITTLPSDLDELNTPLPDDEVVTRSNIGEMMPGASCPLAISVTGRCMEHGLQHMQVSYASRPAITDEWTQIAICSGKMCINLSGALQAATSVLGIDAKSLGHSVCGRPVDELHEPKKLSVFVRLAGFSKLLNYLRKADGTIDKFDQSLENFSLPQLQNSREMLASIDASLSVLNEAYEVHFRSSATSSFASNVLQAIVSGGQDSKPEEEAEAARLMAGATGVESAILVAQLDKVVDLIAEQPKGKVLFQQASAKDALNWLSSEKSGPADQAFKDFLTRHGHRSYRELCVREKCWADDQEALIAIMQASISSRFDGSAKTATPETVDMNSLSRALRWIVPKAHNGARRREHTKSVLVDVTNRIKRAYRYLGELLCKEGRLDDADRVFFFTHQELMKYVNQPESVDDHYWNEHCAKRRLALGFQNLMEFEEVNVGQPQPIDLRSLLHSGDGTLVGRPVSCGTVEGKARVAFSVAEATGLQSGEILVAPITDVGWTPYFSLISGLITDVGSSVSHGAVIAREYGLPAIVNTRTGTKQIKTGDTVRLDGNTGQVTVLARALD